MNTLKKFLSLGVCSTSLLSVSMSAFASTPLKENLILYNENVEAVSQNVDSEKLKTLEDFLQKAFDENNESAIRVIKAVFDKDNVHKINTENVIQIIKNLGDISVAEDSKIVELIKEIVELPMLEDVIADEKYSGLAVFREDILKNSDLNIVTKFMTRNDCFNVGKTIDVKGIMVHSTASPGYMADFWYNPWNKSYQKGETGREVCVHAFLDDKNVYQYLPWNHRGWHCGGKANNTHVSLEICEPEGVVYSANHSMIDLIDIKGTRDYFEKSYKNAVKLCAMLCKQFNLTEKDIICHCEGHDLGVASNHGDVMHWWKFYDRDMDMFRADVKELLENIEKDSVEPSIGDNSVCQVKN